MSDPLENPTIAINSVPDSKEKVVEVTELERAKIHGSFYSNLITTILDPTISTDSDEKVKKLTALVDELPQSMQETYRGQLERFNVQLSKTHDMLAEDRGHEKDVFTSALNAINFPGSQYFEQGAFAEPYPGIFIFTVDNEFFREVQIHPGKSKLAYAFIPKVEGIVPPFMVVPNENTKDMYEKMFTHTSKIDRHETFHLIHKPLLEASVIIPPEEASPELTQAYENTRNEVCAYLLDPGKFGGINPYNFCYTENPEILRTTSETINFISECQNIAEKYGIEPTTFILPTMQSKSFEDLKEKFAALSKEAITDDASKLYDIFDRWRWYITEDGELYKTVVNKLGISLTPEQTKEFILQATQDFAVQDFSMLNKVLEQKKHLIQSIGFQTQEIEQSEIITALTYRMSLPTETIQLLMTIPVEYLNLVSTTGNHSFLLKSLVRGQLLNNERMVDFYKKLINSSEEMKTEYRKVKAQIIENEEGRIMKMVIESEGEVDLEAKIDKYKSILENLDN